MLRIIERLDEQAKRWGLDWGVTPARPRHLRWFPMLTLTLTATGLALHVGGRDGTALVMVAFALSAWFAIFGPLRNPTLEAPLDEREKLLRTRAYLAGTGTVAFIAAFATFLFSLSDFFPLWTPRTDDDWRVLCFALVTVFNSIPPLHASWTTRPIEGE